ncbi:hypothetical protein ACWGF3_06855 [Streptomyces xanthophaeus]
MNTRTRLAVLCPALAAALALGSASFAQATAPSAVTAGTCTVKPSDDGKTVTVTGTAFIGTGGAALRGSSGNAVGLGNLDGLNGVFTQSGLPPGEYLVESQKGPLIRCTAVGSDKDATVKALREARIQGFNEGVKAGKAAAQENCRSNIHKKPHKDFNEHPGLTAQQDQAVQDAFDRAFLAGSTSAFNKFCRTGGGNR